MNKILTDRLILRSFLESDAANLMGYLVEPRADCFLSEKLSTMQEALEEAKCRSSSEECIAICLKEKDILIGDLSYIQDEPDTYSVCWHLNAKYEGKGYASESAQALLNFLFTQKKARRVYAYVEDDNFRSQKLCKKLGMRKEGLFKEFISFRNNNDGTPKYVNTLQFAILKREWLCKMQFK